MRAARIVSLAAVGALGPVGILGAGCSSGTKAGPPVATVTMKNSTYIPAAVSVHVGDTVQWVWDDGTVPHNIDGASDLGPFDSGAPTISGPWSFRFTKTGTFTYHCDVHPAMIGTVTVG